MPAWCLQQWCQQPGRQWQIKRKTSHRGSGDFLANMLIHTLVDWLTLPKYLSFTAMFGHNFTATLVVCDLAHFMHELLWLLLAALLLTTTAGLEGLTSGHFTWVFSFLVRNDWVFTSTWVLWSVMEDWWVLTETNEVYAHKFTLHNTICSSRSKKKFSYLHTGTGGICMFTNLPLNRETWKWHRWAAVSQPVPAPAAERVEACSIRDQDRPKTIRGKQNRSICLYTTVTWKINA